MDEKEGIWVTLVKYTILPPFQIFWNHCVLIFKNFKAAKKCFYDLCHEVKECILHEAVNPVIKKIFAGYHMMYCNVNLPPKKLDHFVLWYSREKHIQGRNIFPCCSLIWYILNKISLLSLSKRVWNTNITIYIKKPNMWQYWHQSTFSLLAIPFFINNEYHYSWFLLLQ